MKRYEVAAVGKFKLKAHDPDETGDYKKTDQGKDKAKADTEKLIARLTGLQERLYANATRSLLIVLQGMDTSGKDGTIRHVMSGVNPQGCKVVTFKAPSKDELAHDFLWRVHREAPLDDGIRHPPVYPRDEHIFVMGSVEDPDESVRRCFAMDPPEKIMRSLQG